MSWILQTKKALYLMEEDSDRYLSRLPYKKGEPFEIPATWFASASPLRMIVDRKRLEPESGHPAPRESLRRPYDPSHIDWHDNNCKISQYFTVGEVTQKDSRRIPIAGGPEEANIMALARELDTVRGAWGSPIGVTSWYRPPEINAAVGGVANSQHIHGSAADIYTMNGRGQEFERWLDSNVWADRALGYGVASGKGFTHLDLRQGHIRWHY